MVDDSADWNGFKVPWFSRDIAEMVVRHQERLLEQWDDAEVESLAWDGDEIVVSPPGGGAVPDSPRRGRPLLHGDGVGLVRVGGRMME